MTAYGISRTGPCRIKDEHLVAANDPKEAERIAADLDEDRNKAQRRFSISYQRAIEDQVQYMRERGAL